MATEQKEKDLHLLYELERLLEHQISQSNAELISLLVPDSENPPLEDELLL